MRYLRCPAYTLSSTQTSATAPNSYQTGTSRKSATTHQLYSAVCDRTITIRQRTPLPIHNLNWSRLKSWNRLQRPSQSSSNLNNTATPTISTSSSGIQNTLYSRLIHHRTSPTSLSAMTGDLTIAIILGIIICSTACALVICIFWLLWRRKESTGSFYMPARNSVLLMEGNASMVDSWKNGSEPALAWSENASRLWKEDRRNSTLSRTASAKPNMSMYPLGRRAVDQLRGMEIADPSGLVLPHELEGDVPSELDATSPAVELRSSAVPWTGRMLSSEANAPSLMRKASLRTRRATRSGRESTGFFIKPSSLGMRKLEKSEIDAELAAGRTSFSPGTAASSVKVSPLPTGSSLRTGGAGGWNTHYPSPLRTDMSHESSELDAESPQRRASFSSWRRSTFDVVPLPPTRTSSKESTNSSSADNQKQAAADSILRRDSNWAERISFPPRATRSLDLPSTSTKYGFFSTSSARQLRDSRPVVVMNSPTNSTYSSGDEYDEEDDIEEPYSPPPSMNLYSPVVRASAMREQWISPLQSPAIFSPTAVGSSAGSSPTSRFGRKVSPLPSPFLLRGGGSGGIGGDRGNSTNLLHPSARTRGSEMVHYPSWSEVSGFDFVKQGRESPEEEDGGDGWRPVPDSAEGRYELAT